MVKSRALRRLMRVVIALNVLAVSIWSGADASAQRTPRKRSIPSGSILKRLVEDYFKADASTKREMERDFDAGYKPLPTGYRFERLRKQILELAAQSGRRIERSGTHYFYPEPRAGSGRKSDRQSGEPIRETGKYIVEAPKSGGEVLFIGMHGGGVGAGDAEGMAAGMGGGGWVWVFPEVLEKTERGWVDSGTEQFVLELAEAARRTFRISADRVYVTGHSMGGHGTWSLASHHPDVFAGGAAYAGGPTPFFESRQNPVIVDLETGLLPNLYRQNFLFFQSGDDPRVPPEPNDYAFEALKGWKKRFSDGFNFRYERVEGRGHAAPAEGYLPTQQWVVSHVRDPWPRRFLWQPTLAWKKQFYWLIWPEPILDSLLQVEVSAPQCIDLRLLEPAGKDPGPFTLLLREPIVDLEKEVRVRVNGEERFRGIVERRFSTLMRTAVRADESNLYSAQLDL